MKNIQVIDSAENAAFDVFEISDEAFDQLFPRADQDIQFADEVDEETWKNLAQSLWANRIEKPEVHGINGTLFFENDAQKRWYPNRKDSDKTALRARAR